MSVMEQNDIKYRVILLKYLINYRILQPKTLAGKVYIYRMSGLHTNLLC